ncbi:hypothetical protein PAXRUDRAFT_16775 [Paxillus rubicundulus Ve08.2h10]|uniref:Uncharacterized protein n=1 Tax=Paxillus rubicundulus Ve08.2h10 TaxID=930991 RepID=A0A0D0D4Q9_9AGAM|nr:hypothetical protein PAXRUDRAFT_16775 [Paxillus rubicundulus Ve08.2h10]
MSPILSYSKPPEMSNQSRLVQIYVASESKRSGFALVDPTSAFNCTVRELICLSAVAPPLLGGHALLPTASVKLTEEWQSEWETWMGGLLRALQDAKDQGKSLVIPYDVVQAIAMAKVAYTNLEGQAEAEQARGVRSGRTEVEVEEGGNRAGGKRKRGGDRHA